MNRRSFGKLAGLGALGVVAGPIKTASLGAQDQPTSQQAQAEIPQRAVGWPGRTYRRLLVDTHVPDWDSHLLADFDPVSYVRSAAKAGFQSLMQYANSHVGLCLWKT